MTALAKILARCPFVAILRGVRPGEAEAIGEALVDEGFAIIEVPLNSPEPFESIRRLAARFGDRALIGAGTVLRREDVLAVSQAGGRLVVMPNADGGIVEQAKRLELLAMPGFATPTEAFAMLRAGADALKLFPAEGASPAVLGALRTVLPPGTLVLPVGGIHAGNLGPWRAAGAAGFGIGSSLYKPGMKPEEAKRRAKELMRAFEGAGPDERESKIEG
jgi:2-dehydro-3-deoxyphosphogalactonate aldolase